MTRNFTGTIAGATIFLIFISIFSKGIGFIREILFASRFGLSDSFDIYLVAAALPIIINTGIYYIGQNYFIPVYNKCISIGEDGSDVLTRNFWLFILYGIITTAVLFLSSDILLNIYVGPSYHINAVLLRNIFNIIIFSFPFAAGAAILSAYINAEFEFRIPAYSTLILNIIIVLMVFFLSDKISVYSIAGGYLAGTFIQLVFLVLYVRSKKNITLKLKIRHNFLKFKPDRVIIFIILIEIIGQIYILIDRWFYSSVDKGGIAALNYAGNLFSLPISLISVSFTAVLFPFFTKIANGNDDKFYKTKIIESLKINNILFVPVFTILLLYGDDIVRIIYQRGRFTSADTVLTNDVLKYLSLSIIFFSGYSILNKSLFALQKVRFLLIITIGAILLKLILSYILVEQLKQNGLALSTSIVYCLIFIICLIVTLKNAKDIFNWILHLFHYLLISAFVLVLIFVVSPLLGEEIPHREILLLLIYSSLYVLTAFSLDSHYISGLNPFKGRSGIG